MCRSLAFILMTVVSSLSMRMELDATSPPLRVDEAFGPSPALFLVVPGDQPAGEKKSKEQRGGGEIQESTASVVSWLGG
jgi:hypothetical protein